MFDAYELAYAIANADGKEERMYGMQKMFVVYDTDGEETGRFSVLLSEKDGLKYRYVCGSFCWQDVVGATTIIAGRMHITRTMPNSRVIFCTSDYKVAPVFISEERFSPVLLNSVTLDKEKLPFTINGDEIQEHYCHLPYETAIKLLLAISMSYEKKVLAVDREKMARLNSNRRRKSVVEVQL